MKNKYSVFLIIIICLFISSKNYAQSFKEDLKVMYNSYLNADDFYAKIKIDMYESSKDAQPYETRKAEISKSSMKVLYKLDNDQVLINDKCVVIINDEEKMILYKPGKKKERSIPDIVMPNFDSLMADYNKVIYKGLVNQSKHYIVNLESSNIKRVDIFLSKESRWLTKLVYYYNEEYYGIDSKVIINFNSITASPNFTKQTFSESQFFRRKNGKVILLPIYKDYRFIEMKEEEAVLKY